MCLWPCCHRLVVISHQRYDTGGGVYATVSAFDFNGNLKWQYDLGQHSSVDIKAGNTQIDSHGNVYVPYFAAPSGPLWSGMLKLDKNGSLVWDYNVGDSVYSGVAGTSSYEFVQGSTFDSSGNIIFSTGMMADGTYARKVDPSGSLVKSYTYPGSGVSGWPVGTLNFVYPCRTLDVDSSDNLYFCEVTGSGPTPIRKVDSSGSYASNSSTPSHEIYCIVINRTTSKILANYVFGFSAVATSTPFLAEYDCSTLTTNWTSPISDFGNALSGLGAATVDPSNSDWFTTKLALSKDLSTVYGIALVLDTMSNVRCTHYAASASSGTLLRLGQVASPALMPQICTDPKSGAIFGIKLAGTNDRLFRIDPDPFSALPTIWSSFNLNNTIRTHCVSARS